MSRGYNGGVIRIYTFTEAGGHPANEDAFAVRASPDAPDRVVVVVADGQGGAPGGGRAARLACDAAAAQAPAGLTDAAAWQTALAAADAAVTADSDAGYTTLIGFGIAGDVLVGASCGDSAVLAVCGSGEVTELTRLQFKNPPVGTEEAVFVPFAAELVRPWKILAMTDGVWKYVGWDRVRELAAKFGGEELLATLQRAARLPRSGEFQDDFTVVLLETGAP